MRTEALAPVLYVPQLSPCRSPVIKVAVAVQLTKTKEISTGYDSKDLLNRCLI